MLTAFQCEVVAYVGDGDVYCPDCALEHVELEGQTLSERAIIRYTLDEEFPGGAWCGACGDELVEPAEDYCTAHESWRSSPDSRRCEYNTGADGDSVLLDACLFLGSGA